MSKKDNLNYSTDFISSRFLDTRLYDFKDKRKCLEYYMRYFFSRTLTMFKWSNLPDTIPEEELERLIQTVGHTSVFEKDGKLYASYGYLGGELNPYYLPKISIVNNPWLNFHKELKIGEDCVVVKNDDFYTGLTPLNRKYGSLLVENDITIRLVDINSRTAFIMAAKDTNTYESSQLFYKRIEDGEGCVIKKQEGLSLDGQEDLTILPTMNVSSKFSTSVNEHHQYILALWWQELGINANYNMKRETLTSTEVGINDNQLIPLIDNMLRCRKLACEQINEMFNTNISVELSGVWSNIRKESDINEQLIEANLNKIISETKVNDSEAKNFEVSAEVQETQVEIMQEQPEDVQKSGHDENEGKEIEDEHDNAS